MTKDRKFREEEENGEAQRINDEVTFLKESLDQEKMSREQNSEELIAKLGDDILKLQDMLNFEKKVSK